MSDNVVAVDVIATDDASPVIEGTGASVEDLGEKVSWFGRIANSVKEQLAEFGAIAKESFAIAAEGADELKEKLTEVATVAETVGSGGGIAGLIGGAGEILGLGVVATMLERIVDHTKDEVLELGHLSAATGVGVDKLSEFRTELERLGAGGVNVNAIVMRMASAMQQAASPTSKQAEAFRQLGVDTEALRNHELSLFEVQEQIAVHLQNSTKAEQDLADIRAVAGRNVVPYIAFLKEEGAELEENMEKHRRLGEATAAAVPAAKELQQAETSLKEVWTELSLTVLPALNAGVRGLTETVQYLAVATADVALKIEDSFRIAWVAAGTGAHILADLANQNYGMIVVDTQTAATQIKDIELNNANARAKLWSDYYLEVADRAKAAAAEKASGSTNVEPADKNDDKLLREQERELNRRAELNRQGRDREIDEEERALKQQEHDLNRRAELNLQGRDREIEMEERLGKEVIAMEKRDAEEVVRIHQLQTQEQVRDIQGDFDLAAAAIKEKGKLHKISDAQELTQLRTLYSEEHQAELQALNNQLALEQGTDSKTLTARQRTEDQIMALKRRYAKQEQQLDDQEAQKRLESEQTLVNSLDTMWSDLTSKQGIQWQKMIETSIKGLVEWGIEAIVMGDALNNKNALNKAREAARNTYASVSQLPPPVGEILAPIAAAGAFAAVLAFEQGGVVSQDSLALVHKNEMVLPRNISEPLQASLANGGVGGGHQFHFSPVIHAFDQRGVSQALQKANKEFMRMARTAVRNGAVPAL